MGLARDQRGAIMVMGVFMGVFLAACLYYVAGVGEAILHRERMQDAADASAFGAAVLHARGMNLLVLINLIMAALMAVLVALRLIDTLLIATIAILFGAGLFSPGLLPLVPKVRHVRQIVADAYEGARGVVHPTLQGLNATAGAVRSLMPLATAARVVHVGRDEYADVAHLTFAVPTNLTLPTEDDRYDRLCDEAGVYVADLVALPLEAIGGDILADLAGGAVRGLVSGGAGWFCAPGPNVPAPGAPVERSTILPVLPEHVRCAEADMGTSEYGSEDFTATCTEASDIVARAGVDPETGACIQDCAPGGAFQRIARLSRESCEPGDDDVRDAYGTLDGFVWQRRRITITYRRVGNRWEPVQRSAPREATLMRTERAPCGDPSDPRGAIVSHDWNREMHDSAGMLVPLCYAEQQRLPRLAREGDVYRIDRIEAAQILGCSATRTVRITPSTDGDGTLQEPPEGQQQQMAPQRLKADATPGGEAFQLRGVALGPPASDVVETSVRAASWGRDNPRGFAHETARTLSRFSVAQAEFYFDSEDADVSPSRFMWEQRWRARLRRFRLASPDAQNPQADAEEGAATTLRGGCKTAAASLSVDSGLCDALSLDISELFIH